MSNTPAAPAQRAEASVQTWVKSQQQLHPKPGQFSAAFNSLLIESEARRRDLVLDWRQAIEGSFPAPAQAVRQIALNLLLNACAASPPGGRITVRADATDGLLTLVVADEGPGLPAEARRLLLDGRAEQVPQAGGLGLWTVLRLMRELHAELQLADPPGTHITIRIPDAERRTHLLAAD